MFKAPIRKIGTEVNEIKVRIMGITTERSIMFELETTIAPKTSTGLTIVIEMTGVGPMFRLKIGMLLLGMVELVWSELKICCKR